jgi:hypothetical protein
MKVSPKPPATYCYRISRPIRPQAQVGGRSSLKNPSTKGRKPVQWTDAFLESVHDLTNRDIKLAPIGRIGREILVRTIHGTFLQGNFGPLVDGFRKIIRPLTRPMDGFPVQSVQFERQANV